MSSIILLQKFPSAVSGAIVYNDQFPVIEGLFQNRLDAGTDRADHVVDRDTDGKEWLSH
jgi:hypothetical protein